MVSAVIQDVDDFIAKLKAEFAPEVKAVENDVKAIGKAALNYIETNGLQDLYQIALTIVGAAVTGAPWGAVLAGIATQAVTDGKQIEAGAVAVVAAQAQADLIAAGKLLPPVSAAPAA